MTNAEKIAKALKEAGGKRLAVFGDYTLDKYLYIDPFDNEVSAETGLDAYQVRKKCVYAGSGGTIANNLRALGAQVLSIGLTGCDGEGYELLGCLRAIGADISLMINSAELCTSTYTKPMFKQPDGSYKESNRFDFRNFSSPSVELQTTLVKRLESCLPIVDAVILIDQFPRRNLSAITDFVRNRVCELAARHPDKLFYADSRAFPGEFRNMIVKCNNFEFMGAASPNAKDTFEAQSICRRAELLRRKTGSQFFVTMGDKGIMGFFDDGVFSVPAVKVTGPVDITGAGDAATAAIVLGMSIGLSPEEAAQLGCCMASLTIQQLGVTGTADASQLIDRFKIYQRGESV